MPVHRLATHFNDKNGWKIFLDLDGVIADFDTHAKKHGKFNDKGQPKWDALDLAWWRSMPVFKGARKFYKKLRKLAPVRFLTAPILDTGCYTGKATWIEKFCPHGRFGLLDLIVCKAENKQFLAGPKHILVDDREKNIREWIEAGGIGILHTGNFEETLAKIEEAIKLPPPAPVELPPEPKVFMNINRVLADFETHAIAHDKFHPNGDTKWDALDAEWWRTMPAFDGAREFYEEVKKTAPTNFLTAPVPNVDGFTAKPEWVKEFLPEKWGGVGVLHTDDYVDTLTRVKIAISKIKAAMPWSKPASPPHAPKHKP